MLLVGFLWFLSSALSSAQGLLISPRLRGFTIAARRTLFTTSRSRREICRQLSQTDTDLSEKYIATNSDDTDYTILSPDDPKFLDMPWPTESGPESAAFARHMQWKRGLSDGERLRWQRWAVYQRMKTTERYEYSLQDYIQQNLLGELHNKAAESLASSQALNASVYSGLELELRATEEAEVRAVMKAYYSAFNRQNLDEVRALWLPDEGAELLLPGYEKARGERAIEDAYKRLLAESKPMGSVQVNIAQVRSFGNIALVHAVEEVGAGNALIAAVRRRKGDPAPRNEKPKEAPRVLATTILRRANKQWRILTHHAVRMWSSPFTGDALDCAYTPRDAERRAAVLKRAEVAEKARAAAIGGLGEAGLPGLVLEQMERLVRESDGALRGPVVSGGAAGKMPGVLRRRPDGTFERVITLDRADVSPAKSVAGTAKATDKQEVETQGDAFVRPPRSVRREERGRKPQGASTGGTADEIDEDASMSKQAVQAVRMLHRRDMITQEDRELLIADVIASLAQDRTSRVETAYEMLYALPVHELQADGDGAAFESANSTVAVGEREELLKDFAAQCDIVLADLRSK